MLKYIILFNFKALNIFNNYKNYKELFKKKIKEFYKMFNQNQKM